MSLLSAIGAPVLSLSWSQIILGLCVLTFVYFLLQALYRLTLHPLAKYPSPSILEAISTWPMISHCYKGNRHLKLLAAHEKHGNIVRMAPNVLSFNTIPALQAIHTDRSANVNRDEWYKSLDISQGAYSTQSCMDKTEHAFRRRVVQQAFSERALRDQEGFVLNNVKTFCDGLGKDGGKVRGKGEWSGNVNLANWATWFGFDFISDISLGRSFGLLTDEETRYIPSCLLWTSQFLYYIGYLPFRALVRPLLGTPIQDYIGGKAAAESYRFTLLAISRMDERMKLEDQNQVSHEKKADGKQRKDVFHYIYHAQDPDTGKSFTKEELQADSALLIAAGSDGVALTISAFVFYLLHNPRTYEKLVAEIRESFASVDEIRGPKVTTLPYLHACIMETMRVAPAIPSDMPRVVLPGGLMIPGSGDEENSDKPVHIPEGTTVFVPQYAIQHNESYYPDPWAFKPERFIVSDEPSAESVARAKKAHCPFSTGSMDCVGKNMAYLAMKLALAHLFWRFDIRLAPPASVKVVDGLVEEWEMGPTGGGHVEAKEEGRRRKDEYQILDFMAGYRDGPTVQLRERA